MATKFFHQPQMKPFHFFKIITTPILHEGKLMIPSRFVEIYGEGLPHTVFLKAPNGDEWELNLEKGNGKIWFENGWKEFAEHYCVVHGHLLLFRFEGTSRFQVRIFDMSALEINYPSTIPCNCRLNNPPNNENLEDHIKGQKRKLNSSKMSSSKCAKVENTLILPKVENTLILPQAALHLNDTNCQEKSMVIGITATALDRASCFKSCNPFFLAVMRPSCLRFPGGRVLNLPCKFGETHLDFNNKKGDINLQVLHGGVWPVKYRMRINHRRKRFELGCGWTKFTRDNNLKVGDVCTFELIHRNNVTFQVHIFRETD